MTLGIVGTALAIAALLSEPLDGGIQAVRSATASPPTAVPPSVYQRDGEKTDVFAHLSLMQSEAERLPQSNALRRAGMVADIRRNVVAARSRFDMGELDRVLSVIGSVEREKFVSKEVRNYAYLPFPLPIGYDQTISDSYIVAVMTAAVHPRAGDHVLDVGTGSGYQAAVLSKLVHSVATIEIVRPLADAARSRLGRLGYRNVSVVTGDGFGGVPDEAPFDTIVVAAGAKAIPQPLIDQLKPGGRMVMPIGPTTFTEQLLLVTKLQDGTVERCSLGPAAFVPFTGRAETVEARSLDGPSSPTTATTATTTATLCYGAPVT